MEVVSCAIPNTAQWIVFILMLVVSVGAIALLSLAGKIIFQQRRYIFQTKTLTTQDDLSTSPPNRP